MRQVVVSGAGTVELWERPDPHEMADGDVRVRARLSLISTGTEGRLVRGDAMPAAVRDAFASLDAFALEAVDGNRPDNRPVAPSYPASSGYNLVGVVEQASAGARELLGRRVMTLTRHVSLVDLPREQVVVVPDEVEDACAVLSYVATLGLHALRRVGFQPGERVAVLGLGVVGATAALLASACGARVTVLDPNSVRREAVAGRRGIATALDPAAEQVATKMERALGGHPDVVIEAAGTDAALRTAIAIVRPAGRIAMVALHPSLRDASLLGDLLHTKDCLLAASWNDPVASGGTGGFDVFDNVAFALELMASGRMDVTGLLSRTWDAEEVAQAFDAIVNRSDFVSVGLTW